MGRNSDGQLGDGSRLDAPSAKLVVADVVAVSTWTTHTVFITAEGTLWGMGYNGTGQLGDGTTIDRPIPVPIATDVVAAAAGYGHTVFIKRDGTLWGMGMDNVGQLGNGPRVNQLRPQLIAADVAAVTAGANHTLFVKRDRTLWGMGWNLSGELGDGTNLNRGSPVLVTSNVAAIAAGHGHSLILKSDGSLWATGRNLDGELGDGSRVSRASPVQIATGVSSIAAGGYHSLFVKNGTLWASGLNTFGQLGDGTATGRSTAGMVGVVVSAAQAGYYHSFVVREDGTLWATGRNDFGQLGDGTLVQRHNLVKVAADAVSATAGLLHSHIIRPGRAPRFLLEPASRTAAPGESPSFHAIVAGSLGVDYAWHYNGQPIAGTRWPFLVVGAVTPSQAGIYTLRATTSRGPGTSQPAILGVVVAGRRAGSGDEVGSDIVHPNGNSYDQVQLTGDAVAVRADAGQVMRTSFVDLSDDIVQVEFSGAGTLTITLESATGPARPANYNQAVNYMKGHARIVVAGADETTNLSVFSVGRMTAFDPTGAFDVSKPIGGTNDPARNGNPIFKSWVSYDGHADLASISILSANGKFGGLRTSNASYFATAGLTGIYAPGVTFTGPVFVGDISASRLAEPVLRLGAASDVRITGGDLTQANGAAVDISGIARLRFTAGQDSHGRALPAQANKAKLTENGVEVTDQVAVNPGL